MQEGGRSFLVVPCLPLLSFPTQHLGPAVQVTVSPGSAVQQCKCQKAVSINHMSSIRQGRHVYQALSFSPLRLPQLHTPQNTGEPERGRGIVGCVSKHNDVAPLRCLCLVLSSF
ncbi:hypothetical protein CGRA01v4_05748 [Colletotrichum graminicola]|nr:hypothetical protein CGRA01v4_05748 [Colletotrichum graminicola]